MSSPIPGGWLLAHPTGNANTREAALALRRAGLLSEYWTGLAPSAGDLWVRALPVRLRAQALRREIDPALRGIVRPRPLREACRMVCGALKWGWPTRHEQGWCCVDNVYRDLDHAVAQRVKNGPKLQGVYAYEDGAADLFAAARERGIPTVYDLPIGYWRAGRRIQTEERELQPEWANTMQALVDSAPKLARKDDELARADLVLVASTFTASTLAEAPQAPARVERVIYGCPTPAASPGETRRDGPLKVLFVGGLSQRKGMSYLLDAVAKLGPAAELTLIGRPAGPSRPLEDAMKRHRWIATLPHAEVMAEMRRHDVLVFPSLFEGFGLVLVEALASGLPVIATPHTAGPDVLTEGVDGWVVPIRSSDAIAAKLETLHRDRNLLAAMKEAALAKARSLTWDAYRAGVVAAVGGMTKRE